MEITKRMNKSENSWESGLAVDFPIPPTLPFFCSSEAIEKLPYSLFYCLLYMLGCAVVMAFGFYLYYRRSFLLLRNGFRGDRQYTDEESGNSRKLLRMLCREPNTSSVDVETTDIYGNQRVTG